MLWLLRGGLNFLEAAKSRVGDQLPLSLGVLPELALLGELAEQCSSLLVLLCLLLLSLEFYLKRYLLSFQLGNSFFLLLLFFLVIPDLGVRAPAFGAHLEPKDKYLSNREQPYIWTPLPFEVLT